MATTTHIRVHLPGQHLQLLRGQLVQDVIDVQFLILTKILPEELGASHILPKTETNHTLDRDVGQDVKREWGRVA